MGRRRSSRGARNLRQDHMDAVGTRLLFSDARPSHTPPKLHATSVESTSISRARRGRDAIDTSADSTSRFAPRSVGAPSMVPSATRHASAHARRSRAASMAWVWPRPRRVPFEQSDAIDATLLPYLTMSLFFAQMGGLSPEAQRSSPRSTPRPRTLSRSRATVGSMRKRGTTASNATTSSTS